MYSVRLIIVLALALKVSSVFAQSPILPTSETKAMNNSSIASVVQKPEILLLGVAHFASTRNMQNPVMLDSLLPERQKQVQEVIDDLAKFHPTKIAIESPVDSAEIEPRYQSYLAGHYALGNNERDQIGFRLAKMLGQTQIFPIDFQMDLGFDTVVEFSQKHGQQAIFDEAAMDTALLDKINTLRNTGTLRDELKYLNTDEALKLNLGFYMTVSRIGADSDYPGADMASEWYKRNLIIFSNLTRIVTSPKDRILVVFGQGHIAPLKQFIQASPDYTLADTEEYLR